MLNQRGAFVFLDGDVVRLLLRKRGFRQKKAAKQIGISPAQFSRVLDSKRPLRLASFVALCELLKPNNPEALIKREEPAHAS